MDPQPPSPKVGKLRSPTLARNPKKTVATGRLALSSPSGSYRPGLVSQATPGRRLQPFQ